MRYDHRTLPPRPMSANIVFAIRKETARKDRQAQFLLKDRYRNRRRSASAQNRMRTVSENPPPSGKCHVLFRGSPDDPKQQPISTIRLQQPNCLMAWHYQKSPLFG